MSNIKGYEKKQKLTVIYYGKIKSLKSERSKINSELKICEEKFAELINTEADLDQLSLFDNLDQFLIG